MTENLNNLQIPKIPSSNREKPWEGKTFHVIKSISDSFLFFFSYGCVFNPLSDNSEFFFFLNQIPVSPVDFIETFINFIALKWHTELPKTILNDSQF